MFQASRGAAQITELTYAKKDCPPPAQIHPDPLLASLKCTTTLDDRFWSKVTKTSTCWNWVGGKSSLGRGFIRCGSKGSPMLQVHRLSWLIHFGNIPAGLFVCHHCDNGLCVRPDHLFLGTPQDNVDDKVSKCRQSRHENHGRTILSKEQVEYIRATWKGRGLGPTQKSFALAYGVDRSTISLITCNRNWIPA
jgi:hypothetical protein